MSNIQRKTGGRNELDALHSLLNALFYRTQHSIADSPGTTDGTTAGKLKTVNSTDFTVAGLVYTKAGTDDLWDLSAETDTIAAQYRAYWLYVDAAGTATIAAGANATSRATALAALPDLVLTESVFGAYVADPSTDFDDAGGLVAQGTVFEGIVEDMPGVTASLDLTELIAP